MKIVTTFDDLEKMGFQSVTDYCRMLVEEGYEDNSTVEVYRGEMLCLTVSSIEEAAKVMPKNSRWVKFDKTRRKAS